MKNATSTCLKIFKKNKIINKKSNFFKNHCILAWKMKGTQGFYKSFYKYQFLNNSFDFGIPAGLIGIGSEFVWLKLRSARAGFSLSSKSLKKGLFQVFSKNFFLRLALVRRLISIINLVFWRFFRFCFLDEKCNQKFFVVRSVKICIVCVSCLPQSVKQSSDVILKKC